MIKKEVKKLWRGCISIRKGWVDTAIKSGGLEIKFENQTMFFSPDYLKRIDHE